MKKKATSKTSNKVFNVVTQVARVLVGLLFIFSGFIKANDPYGFSYKLEEYFDVFNEHLSYGIFVNDSYNLFNFFHDHALGLAIFITGLEMLQGVLLLTGSRIKINSWLLLMLIVFFTFLTFYSAYTGYIKQCGCFGDVIPLKAWQSFYKDLILLVLIVIIMFGRKYIKPIIKKPMFDNALVGAFTVIAFVIPIYAWAYLPIIDMGEFAPGKNLVNEKKAYYDTLAAMENRAVYIYKNLLTGKNEEFPKDTIMKKMALYDSTKYKFIDKIVPGLDTTKLLPLVVALDIKNEYGDNLVDSIYAYPKAHFILIMTHLKDANVSSMDKINNLAQFAEKDGIPFIGVTAESPEKIDSFRHEHQNAFTIYGCTDDTPLKGAIRSNPGLMLMNNGVVIQKWSWRDIPAYNNVKEKYLKK